MSEYDNFEDRRKEPPPEAAVHIAGKWSPWVWVIPTLAIFFVGYLIVRYGFFGGGDVTVRFAEARGLDRYSPVRFRGAKVGTVQKITVDEELAEVVVRISMDASMNHALNKGTKFWIVEPGLEGGGIGSILSGTYVAIAPGKGEESREFVGQEYAPVLSSTEPGRTFILEAEGLGGVSVGTPVTYQGMRVGRVLGAEFDERRGITMIHAHVVQRWAGHVRQATRWWRGGGLNLSLGGGGVSMQGASLASLLNSPISFYTPTVMAGQAVTDQAHFELHESQAAAVAAADGPHLTYLTYFPGSIGGLKPGTPVQMKGVQVGRVREVRLRYLPQSQSLETPVVLEIDPRQLEIMAATRDELRGAMNSALGSLVRKGMRATLATSLVLPGASAVSLETVAAPNTARLLVEHDPPIIPVAQGGDGIAGAMSAITDVANTIRSLPIREIAGNMRSTAARLDALVNDPRLDDSLQRLNNSLIAVEKAASTAGANVDPLMRDIRDAAASAKS
ncbi:MAG TPA: MlaD family protein, partial [Thermoanaerobaculia bacterium]|nr:MlaD family protein [Thermoanaerobaculia bacterium]